MTRVPDGRNPLIRRRKGWEIEEEENPGKREAVASKLYAAKNGKSRKKENRSDMGKVFVIEGSDGSGKETQTRLLFAYLQARGCAVRKVSYPNYESESSALVRMYLGREFGEDPFAVNPYVTSAFYAVDRFASYLKEWKEFYESGDDHIVICDRYVTSNMLHQAAKLDTMEEKAAFLDWEYDFEYVKGGLPVPDQVFFLDVPPEVSARIMRGRANKFTHGTRNDIHEANPDFLRRSYENGIFLAEKYGWERIECCDKAGNLKSIEEIHGALCAYFSA